MPRQRLKSVVVLQHRDHLLFSVGHDPAGPHGGAPRDFLIPVGGGIEFGERAADAARREVQEELGITVDGLVLLGVLENIFTWNGSTGHEVVFCYLADIADRAVVPATLRESDGTICPVRWLTIAELAGQSLPVFPSGIFGLLRSARRDG